MSNDSADLRATGWVDWPVRKPWPALILAAAAAILALLGIRRLSADASLESMIDRHNPAATAMVSVLHHFRTVEDLLVLASLPANDTDSSRLIAFAERFESAVRAAPQASELVDAVTYRPDAQTRAFFEKVLVPAGMFYLDDASFAAARQRLTKDEMVRQIRRNEAMIAAPGPAADALASALLQDPLRLHEFLLAQLKGGGRSFNLAPDSGGAFLSPDGRSLLIRVSGKGSVSDLDFAKRITATIGDIATRANVDGLEIDITGAYAIASASERAIRGDMIVSVISSVIFLQLLFVVAYRRPIRSFLLAFCPVAIGILWGFGVYSMFSRTISPAIAVVGAILAGMGIDYTVQYLSQYQNDRRRRGLGSSAAATRATRVLGPALLGACATSVIGFLSIGGSGVKALRDFSFIGSLGLIGALVATFWIVPALLALTDCGDAPAMLPRWDMQPFLRFVARRRRAFLAASVVILIAAFALMLASRELLPLEADLQVMHPHPNPPLDAEAKLAKRMGTDPGSLLIHLSAANPDDLLRVAHRVARQLDTPSVRDAGVVGSFGLATLLPDPDRIAPRRAAVTPDDAVRVVADFRSVIAESAFSPDAYEPYAGFLQTLLTNPRAPTIDDLLLFPRLAEMLLSKSAFDRSASPEAITLVFLSQPLDSRDRRTSAVNAVRAALAGVPGATLTGLSVIHFDTEQTIHHGLPRLLLIAGGLVTLYLVVHYRSIGAAVLATLPAIFSLACLIAFMRLADQKLNMMNLIAIPLLIGMDVDFGIFLVSLARRCAREGIDLTDGLAASCHAVCISAFTTILGFGSLVTTSVPAIRSLGGAVGVGMVACLAGTLFLLAPILLILDQRRSRIAVATTAVEAR